jgi:hypothetical protein
MRLQCPLITSRGVSMNRPEQTSWPLSAIGGYSYNHPMTRCVTQAQQNPAERRTDNQIKPRPQHHHVHSVVFCGVDPRERRWATRSICLMVACPLDIYLRLLVELIDPSCWRLRWISLIAKRPEYQYNNGGLVPFDGEAHQAYRSDIFVRYPTGDKEIAPGESFHRLFAECRAGRR